MYLQIRPCAGLYLHCAHCVCLSCSVANITSLRCARIDPMKGLDVEAFIRAYVQSNDDPMKDYETVKDAIELEELEEQTKAAIAAQLAKGNENKKEQKKRRKEEAKRNKQEAKMLRKSRAKS